MRLLITIFLLLNASLIFAQVNTNFTQFFINPYLYNPSYAGADAQGVVFLTYRNQWTGFDGAPTVANASFHAPIGRSVGFGINFTNEEKSILNTTSAQFSFSYALPLGENSFLRFGVSGGGAFNTIDLAELEDLGDPAFADLMENNIYVIGNAGLSLQIKSFNFGISAPNILTEQYVTTENFSVGEIEPLEHLIISASNRFYFANGQHIFEPTVLYRYSDILPPQLEIAGILHINHVVWVGGSYKEDFGVSAFGGVKLKQKFGFGYSYSLAGSGINEITSPTHEVHLSFMLSEKSDKRNAYSFINSEKAIAKKPVVAKKEEPVKEPVKEEEAKADPVKEEIKETVADIEKKETESTKADTREEKDITTEPVVTPLEENKKEDAIDTSAPINQPVVVKRGGHLLELEQGQYVVVGAFSNYENAERYSDQLFIKGYPTRFGYITENGLWYVYLFRSEGIQAARTERDKARKNRLFSKAWVLTVQQ